MHVDFYLESGKKKKITQEKVIFSCNWHDLMPEKDWKVTLMIKSAGKKIQTTLAVTRTEEQDDGSLKIWIDADSLTSALQDNSVEICSWLYVTAPWTSPTLV